MLVFYLTLIDDEKDKDRFEKLYHSYKNQMTYVAMSIVQNDVDAEDIVHDVFVKIATRHMDTVNQISEEVDLRNYMLKATKNTAINWKEKKKRYLYTTDKTEKSTFDSNVSDDRFIEYLCEKAEYDRVLEGMKALEPRYRDVLYYHFVLEMSVAEVAKYLDQSMAATKQQLVRGKKKLLLLLGEKENGND